MVSLAGSETLVDLETCSLRATPPPVGEVSTCRGGGTDVADLATTGPNTFTTLPHPLCRHVPAECKKCRMCGRTQRQQCDGLLLGWSAGLLPPGHLLDLVQNASARPDTYHTCSSYSVCLGNAGVEGMHTRLCILVQTLEVEPVLLSSTMPIRLLGTSQHSFYRERVQLVQCIATIIVAMNEVLL